MAKSRDDDKVIVIPLEDRVPELEEQVKRFMFDTPDLPVNEILHRRTVIPKFSNEWEQERWEVEEIKRCRDGYQGMCGKMYMWFHYGFIKNLTGGKIEPEFRVADDVWFQEITDAEASQEWGLICVKRRRAGFSWKAALDALHSVMIFPHSSVGMNSKSDRDSIHLFRKIMFLYDNLPAFLKSAIGAKSGMKVEYFVFDEDENGNKKRSGTESELIVVPPTDSAFEGMMLSKWVADEAGKTKNLPQIWSYTEDCLMEEMRRVGIPILFGTSGDIGKDGIGLLEMWTNSDIYKLKRFFFGGWMGIAVDKFGNDRKEDAIRWIIYERKRRERLSSKAYNDFLQRYPLTVDEAFSQAGGEGIGDIGVINRQKSRIREERPVIKRGIFKEDLAGKVGFVPDRDGPIKMFIDVDPTLQGGYLGGNDPADHDDALPGASLLSTHIISKPNGVQPPQICMEYADRPAKLNDYYNQMILALRYYNNAPILIERNRYRIIEYTESVGYKHLLAITPQKISKMVVGRANSIGVHMTEDTKSYMVQLIEWYLEEYGEHVWSYDLLQQCLDYGTKNTDLVFSFGMALMLLKEHLGRDPKKKGDGPVGIRTKLIRQPNGVLTRVPVNGSSTANIRRPSKKIGFINPADFAQYHNN
jgi:hypothetical protein